MVELSVGSSQEGACICKTGLVSDTQCGQINELGVDFEYDLGGGRIAKIANAGTANILNCNGDSGGPLYKSNKAYGIVSGEIGDPTSSMNDFNTGIGIRDVSCFYQTAYVGMVRALQVTNTKLIGTQCLGRRLDVFRRR